MTAAFPADRSQILTETRNPAAAGLHAKDPLALVQLLVAESQVAVAAVAAAEIAIASFVSAVEPGFRRGGRLVYFGAGTSGRLGVLDASECPPTFQVDPGRVVGLIAGGDGALRKSSEGMEDDSAGAIPELARLGLTADDAVLGIAAGGTTPYVRGGLEWAACLASPPITGLLSCAPVAAPMGCGHLLICASGPEVVTGSTRLKAGTATKVALNAISTALMVRIGKVYDNLMVDVRATNLKLCDRAARIVSALTGLDRATAFALLERAGGSAKTAVVMHHRGLERSAAEALLVDVGGRLDEVLGG